MLHETLEYLGIAFISSVLLIIMSKIILQALIRRPADYYDAEELRQEELMLNAAGISITHEHETNPEGEPIEETHLEAQLGDFTPAEPEEIITDIPDAVHESIEIMEDEEEPAEDQAAEQDDAVYEEPDEVVEIAETEDYIDLPEEEAEEPEPETEHEAEASEDEPDYTFRIKAKTSRTKKPKRKEDEEKAEEEAAARAAMEAAQAAQDDRVPGWTESYADIRQSLEKAFDDKESRTASVNITEDGSPEAGESKETAPVIEEKPAKKKKKRIRKPRPSMKMNKKELTDIARSRGIDVPEEATKRQILDLIYEQTDQKQDDQK